MFACSALLVAFFAFFAHVGEMEIESNIPRPDNITTAMQTETRRQTVPSALTAGIKRADLNLSFAQGNADDKVNSAMNDTASRQVH